MKKKITKKGYRVLAIVWTLAAASMSVAFVRRLAEFNLPLLALTALSILVAANFWKSYRRTPEQAQAPRSLFDSPPKFSGDPVLFDDDPPCFDHPNKDSEENTHE